MEAKPDLSWYDADVLSNALTTYNYRNTHTSINMTPNEARKDSNTMTVKTKLEVNRVQKRKYPNMEEGDEVRIYTKRKNFAKERVPVWSETKHKVVKHSELPRAEILQGRGQGQTLHEARAPKGLIQKQHAFCFMGRSRNALRCSSSCSVSSAISRLNFLKYLLLLLSLFRNSKVIPGCPKWQKHN
jgi:hypothetical protein